MQIIQNLDKEKLGCYKDKIITDEVVLTDERLYQHILICHGSDYKDFKPYIKDVIKYPDFIIVDNKHEDTMIYLKQIPQINKKCRIVIKLATYEDKEHSKNSIITMMKLNGRTWEQTIKNRGQIIWQKS